MVPPAITTAPKCYFAFKIWEKVENNSTFILDGTAPDVSRPITGEWRSIVIDNFQAYLKGIIGNLPSVSGAGTSNNSNGPIYGFNLDISRMVKTANEFSPRTLSVLYWRRVA